MPEERLTVDKVKNKTSERKKANELDGRTWLKYSISVWNDLKKTKEEAKWKHPAMFPSALALRLIECFTTKEARLLLNHFTYF